MTQNGSATSHTGAVSPAPMHCLAHDHDKPTNLCQRQSPEVGWCGYCDHELMRSTSRSACASATRHVCNGFIQVRPGLHIDGPSSVHCGLPTPAGHHPPCSALTPNIYGHMLALPYHWGWHGVERSLHLFQAWCVYNGSLVYGRRSSMRMAAAYTPRLTAVPGNSTTPGRARLKWRTALPGLQVLRAHACTTGTYCQWRLPPSCLGWLSAHTKVVLTGYTIWGLRFAVPSISLSGCKSIAQVIYLHAATAVKSSR